MAQGYSLTELYRDVGAPEDLYSIRVYGRGARELVVRARGCVGDKLTIVADGGASCTQNVISHEGVHVFWPDATFSRINVSRHMLLQGDFGLRAGVHHWLRWLASLGEMRRAGVCAFCKGRGVHYAGNVGGA